MPAWAKRIWARFWAEMLPWWGRVPLPAWLRWILVWLVNQKFLVGVGAVIFDDQRRVMLFKHTYRHDYAWGLPGGWLQKGEEPAHAVEREVREETGLEVCITRPLQVETWRRYPALDITFLGRCQGGKFRPSAEVSEVGYFTLDDLPPLNPNTVKTIERAYREEYIHTIGIASGSM